MTTQGYWKRKKQFRWKLFAAFTCGLPGKQKQKSVLFWFFAKSPIVHISTNAHRHSFLTELFHIKDKTEMSLDNKKEC